MCFLENKTCEACLTATDSDLVMCAMGMRGIICVRNTILPNSTLEVKLSPPRGGQRQYVDMRMMLDSITTKTICGNCREKTGPYTAMEMDKTPISYVDVSETPEHDRFRITKPIM